MRLSLAGRLVVLVALAACSSSPTGPLSAAELRELSAAESLWRQRGPAHYSIEMRRLCFCGGEVTEWATVEVRNNTVLAQTMLNGTPVSPSLWSSRPPVSTLFTEIREMRAFWLKDIQVTYDATTGYPSRVQYIENDNIADAGSVLEVRNLIALTP